MKKILPILLGALLALSACQKKTQFTDRMVEVMQTELSWRTDSTGIWETAGWWNSANVLTAVIRYATVDKQIDVLPTIDDVFTKAQHYYLRTDSLGNEEYADNFINDYYDDEGWWALAWIEAYKLTGEKKYLDMAEILFADMTTGYDETFNGGIYWRKNPLYYKNAIANNLFSLTAARLYKQTEKQEYKDWFVQNVEWYLNTGMINDTIWQVEDGLTQEGVPNRNRHYTYNQGVCMAVLTEMYLLTNDEAYLTMAKNIADATIQKELITEDGILREMRPEIEDGGDGVQFKGIFIRHLAFLYEVTGEPSYKEFIIRNAESILANDYDAESKSFGCYWYGPFHRVHAAANSCALECVIEAEKLSK